ncbi:MAG: hypothetical protein JWM09_1382 [Francisellaceae bacterium]|nr:hypothetical protein [Francisellaceae bacterium]
MKNVFVVFSSILILLTSPINTIFANELPITIYELMNKNKDLTRHQKIDIYSQFFLNYPYGAIDYPNEDLSDGNLSKKFENLMTSHELQYDFKKFDCVTYVETVLALANVDFHQFPLITPEVVKHAFESSLKRIRYSEGKYYFFNRNHFVSVDWIPNNKWLLEDITNKISQTYKMTHTDIDRLNWAYHIKLIKALKEEKEGKRELFNIPSFEQALKKHKITLKSVKSKLLYIEVKEIINNYDKYVKLIPEVSIIHIVRPNWDLVKSLGTHLDVSHVGIALKRNNEIYFRHATLSGEIVEETTLKAYLLKFVDSPTIKGINILQVK